MTLIDFDRLESIDPAAFQSEKPYSWVNPEGALTTEGFQALREALPPIEEFEAVFGRKRKFGQRSHDRYLLEYVDRMELPPVWQTLLTELRGERYYRFLCRLSGVPELSLRFHWHYTPAGCAVSPHCDSKHKLGSHIFYFNTENDWKQEWGGQTVMLGDDGRFASNSAPDFEAFDDAITAEVMGNRSLLFIRRGNSWHGVREITCPEGSYRKVFIVVIEQATAASRLRRLRSRLLRGD